LDEPLKKEIPGIEKVTKAQPEDLVLLSFSSFSEPLPEVNYVRDYIRSPSEIKALSIVGSSSSALLVSCPSDNIMGAEPSDSYETETVCAEVDR
jgi:hypothetical protein